MSRAKLPRFMDFMMNVIENTVLQMFGLTAPIFSTIYH